MLRLAIRFIDFISRIKLVSSKMAVDNFHQWKEFVSTNQRLQSNFKSTTKHAISSKLYAPTVASSPLKTLLLFEMKIPNPTGDAGLCRGLEARPKQSNAKDMSSSELPQTSGLRYRIWKEMLANPGSVWPLELRFLGQIKWLLTTNEPQEGKQFVFMVSFLIGLS